MKLVKYIQPLLALVIVVATVSSCGVKRHPGTAYMPDMAYSRAYETYILRDTAMFSMDRDSAAKYHKIFYNNQPVAGTMQVDELMPYAISNDSVGYVLSASVKNPLGPLTTVDSIEAGRLFNINCAICHGAEGKANGPIAQKIGAVANLTQPTIKALSDGTMFHVITYGKNNMGSYAAQLSREQRWRVIQYIRSMQGPADTVRPAAPLTPVVKAADTLKKVN